MTEELYLYRPRHWLSGPWKSRLPSGDYISAGVAYPRTHYETYFDSLRKDGDLIPVDLPNAPLPTALADVAAYASAWIDFFLSDIANCIETFAAGQLCDDVVSGLWEAITRMPDADALPDLSDENYADSTDTTVTELKRIREWARPLVPRAGATPAKATGRPHRKAVTVEQRMSAMLIEDASRVQWSARKWADALGCTETAVKLTKAWTKVMTTRALYKADRASR